MRTVNRREISEKERVNAEIERGDRRDNLGSALKVLATIYFVCAILALKALHVDFQPAFWITLLPFIVLFSIGIYFQEH